MPTLLTLAIKYRSAQFTAHMAHNLVSGPTFFADHAFLGELYSTYEDGYDSLVERAIGLGQSPNIVALTSNAVVDFKDKAGSLGNAQSMFKTLLGVEKELCSMIAGLVKDATDGTQNLLQGLADESEVRQYKIGQRVK
jgi:DNA-binding ferritin-like protein